MLRELKIYLFEVKQLKLYKVGEKYNAQNLNREQNKNKKCRGN